MAYSTIIKPNTNFTPTIYTGTGSAQSITSLDFQPDLVWLKGRSVAYNHRLYDSIRGAGTKLSSDTTSAESTDTNEMSAFLSNGFTLGSDAGTNGSGATYASWNWKAGGTASSNTDGTITSSVSANTDSGFSIVSFTGNGVTGATVGHGLGVKPAMIILKTRSNAVTSWAVYHQSLGATKYLTLNLTNASTTSNTRWNDVEPTSSVFSLGSSGDVNTSSATIIAYCFAEKKGFSKMGSYVGNGSADGTFVYTGFKPAFIMLKKSSASGNNWQIRDNKRQGYNATTGLLKPNKNDAEQNTDNIDLLSNGFKQRNLAGDDNTSGATYIYMAFAENPLVANTSGGIPTTAR